MNTQTHFETWKKFKPVYDTLLAGTTGWKVKRFNGYTGICVAIEYTLDEEDLEDMKAVAGGYYTETTRWTKK